MLVDFILIKGPLPGIVVVFLLPLKAQYHSVRLL
eukprot:XP_001704038.1 Hypothetical protein GL50803_38206 [Giardia lamblia ATCC 50803]